MSKAAIAAGFATVNPSTGEEIETFSYFTPAQTEKVVAQADKSKSLPVGDPFKAATDLGPMARADLRDSLHKQVQDSIAKGAGLLCGGIPVEGKGAFYPPTVLSGVTEGMLVFDEETFGPVAALTRVPDIDSAVHAANASQFGLSSNLGTRDVELARRIARDLYTGGVFINGFTATNPRVPAGGVKNSGYGRELSHFGARLCKRTNRLD
jgi:acyl-CoA reductase-like NAD-dependent aldehyde dehydrogenase